MWRKYLIALSKYLSNGVFHTPIEDNLTPTLREFMVRSKIPNFTPDLIHHNSCIFGLNEQCKGTLSLYTSRNFQWYHGGPIECFFSFSTKALNIWNSRTSVTPKVEVHLRIIGLHILHPPSFVKMCFTPEHTFLTHGPLHSTFSHELDVKLATYNFNMCTWIIVQYQWKWIKTCEILIMFNEKPNITQIWKIITHNIMTPWQNFILLNQKSKTHHFW
jgi:hypothetical protein